MQDEMSEFLKGLTAEEGYACIRDQSLFGTAMVEVVDGIKRRIPPHEWPYVAMPGLNQGMRVVKRNEPKGHGLKCGDYVPLSALRLGDD